VGLMCGLGPLDDDAHLIDGMIALNRLGIRAWQRHRRLAAPFVRTLMEVGARLTPRLWTALLSLAPPQPDRQALRAGLARDLAASFHAGIHARGMLDELDLIVSPWPFELESVEVPVWMWHGERDAIVPPAVARRMAERLPDVRATWFTDEGHFSLIANRMPEMLRELCSADRADRDAA